jgi:hypothetical protein
VASAANFARFKAGSKSAAKMAMMAISYTFADRSREYL